MNSLARSANFSDPFKYQEKRIGIIQSSYIPWRGYFDFIRSVDLFVIYDDVQYSTGSWRNRNQIKTSSGPKWITIPVKTNSRNHLIEQVSIGESPKPWRETHRNLLKFALGSAPFFQDALDIWESAIASQDSKLSPLNIRLIHLICEYLQIQTPIALSSQYPVEGSKTQRLINLLKKLDATVYLSGPTAKGYLEEDLFRENGMSLEYKTYDYPPYSQLWGNFVGAVSVVDLIANIGPEAKNYIGSLSPNEVAVP